MATIKRSLTVVQKTLGHASTTFVVGDGSSWAMIPHKQTVAHSGCVTPHWRAFSHCTSPPRRPANPNIDRSPVESPFANTRPPVHPGRDPWRRKVALAASGCQGVQSQLGSFTLSPNWNARQREIVDVSETHACWTGHVRRSLSSLTPPADGPTQIVRQTQRPLPTIQYHAKPGFDDSASPTGAAGQRPRTTTPAPGH